MLLFSIWITNAVANAFNDCLMEKFTFFKSHKQQQQQKKVEKEKKKYKIIPTTKLLWQHMLK